MWQQISFELGRHAEVYLAAALILGGLTTVFSVMLLVRVRSLTRPFARVRRDSHNVDELLPAVLCGMEEIVLRSDDIKAVLDKHIEESHSFIRHLGLVRYDAFDDIAGKQSFSMCLLDSRRNGVVLTYLTSKQSTRSYAVTVELGETSRKLSEEEERALNAALLQAPISKVRIEAEQPAPA